MIALSFPSARAIDESVIRDYGLPSQVLVESAGNACAETLFSRFADRLERVSLRSPLVVLCGSGNNAADGLCAARRLAVLGRISASHALVVLKSPPAAAKTAGTPFGINLTALERMGAKILSWTENEEAARSAFADAAVLLDALSGTGLNGPLDGPAAAIAAAVNGSGSFVVAVDLPSGLFDSWNPPAPLIRARATLAIEPVKSALFIPGARKSAGELLFVRGVFPPESLRGPYPELIGFAEAASRLPAVEPDAYKHRRGVLEIHAGSAGSAGAASLSASGAVAAGVGLATLVVDDALWPVLAPTQTSVMVRPSSVPAPARRRNDAYLAGPGWGTSAEREKTLRALAEEEKAGAALILDADAIRLARSLDLVFSGRTVLTPHPAEFSDLAGCRDGAAVGNPDELVLGTAAGLNAVVVLKGHVIRVAAPDGRLAYIDGMEPILAAGGSGDVLAGLCAALCAREHRRASETGGRFDPFPSAVASAALLIEAGRRARASGKGFCDAAAIAASAASAAAEAWLDRVLP